MRRRFDCFKVEKFAQILGQCGASEEHHNSIHCLANQKSGEGESVISSETLTRFHTLVESLALVVIEAHI